MKMEQVKPCPDCGQTAGWWSGINMRMSLIFHAPNGEVTEERITEKKRKNCTNCNSEITACVKVENNDL